MSILNLGTYPPKQCGIASFSKDLRDNLELSGRSVQTAAVVDKDAAYEYPAEVVFTLRKHQVADYEAAARLINTSQQIEICIIQHEYGIYGGADGEYLLTFADLLKKPYILVTHTVLPLPSENQYRVLLELSTRAAAVVCMSRRSVRLLALKYAVPLTKIEMIHHGVPVFPEQDRELLKELHGIKGKKLITTFGLIGPGKGLENGIRAVAKILPKHPDVQYLIAGETHPNLRKREGESYRDMLIDLTSKLNLQHYVGFINQFLPLNRLGDYLSMSDIYLSPYPNRDQAVSGTLAYALGSGRAIISTPYEYALEMLQEGRGIIARSSDPDDLAESIDILLGNPSQQAALEERARRLGKKMQWPYVAERYGILAEGLVGCKPVKRLDDNA